MSDILRQVDEDLRKDKLLKVWRSYRIYIIGFLLIILISLSYYQYHLSSERYKNEAIVEKYINALNVKNNKASIGLLAELDDSINPYIKGLAKIKRADIYFNIKEESQAIELLESTFNDESLDKVIRDLALYKYLMIQLDVLDKETYLKIIDSGDIKESSFIYLFKELKALKFLIEGDKFNSLEIFQSIISDENAPINVKTRSEKFKKIIR